jgi:hypothetical protein
VNALSPVVSRKAFLRSRCYVGIEPICTIPAD